MYLPTITAVFQATLAASMLPSLTLTPPPQPKWLSRLYKVYSSKSSMQFGFRTSTYIYSYLFYRPDFYGKINIIP